MNKVDLRKWSAAVIEAVRDFAHGIDSASAIRHGVAVTPRAGAASADAPLAAAR